MHRRVPHRPILFPLLPSLPSCLPISISNSMVHTRIRRRRQRIHRPLSQPHPLVVSDSERRLRLRLRLSPGTNGRCFRRHARVLLRSTPIPIPVGAGGERRCAPERPRLASPTGSTSTLSEPAQSLHQHPTPTSGPHALPLAFPLLGASSTSRNRIIRFLIRMEHAHARSGCVKVHCRC